MTQKSTSEDVRSNASTTSSSGNSPASGASSQGSSAGSTGGDSIQTATRELTGGVSHMASGIADEAKKAAETKLGAGKDFAAEHLGSVADALRKTSKSLGSENVATSYIEKAAGSVDSVSQYFQTRTLSQLVNDVEGYARREPAVFLGGAFFVGMLGGRFLKAATPAPQGQGNRESPGSRQGHDRQGSQGNRQGAERHDGHAHGQHQGGRAQQSGTTGGGQGNPSSGGSTRPGTAVSTGTASTSSSSRDEKPGNDKASSDKSGSSFAERATEPGFKGAGGTGSPAKGPGAS